MSRYTDLMNKEKLSAKEKSELFLLVLQEFEREERRLSKLPVDAATRQESLWNVIDAHWEILQTEFEKKEALQSDHSELKNRVYEEYRKYSSYLYGKQHPKEEPIVDDFEIGSDASDEDINIIKTGRNDEAKDGNESSGPLGSENAQVEEIELPTRQLLGMADGTFVDKKELEKASNELTMKKCEYQYSVAGDRTITERQRKALYQFHHWMRKHNATAKVKWSGFGYKGSAVDFSERFMRLPARVQLKALYLVETDKRKHPIEEVDNVLSQDYVPDYNKLKKKMTSNFLFVRKRLNGTRYLWNKLEQAANIANNNETVEKLTKFTDALNSKQQEKSEAIDFFMPKESGFGYFKHLRAQAEMAKKDSEDPQKERDFRKERKEDYKKYKAALDNYYLLVKASIAIGELKKQKADSDGQLNQEEQDMLQQALHSIDCARKKLAKNKHFLEDYRHYFFKQTGDLAGYAGIGTGMGTGMYKLLTEASANTYIGASVSLLTIPNAFMNCINDIRAMFNEKETADKVLGGADLLVNAAYVGSKGISAANFVVEVGETAANVGSYLCTGALGVSSIITLSNSLRAQGKLKKADGLSKSFEALKKNLDEKIRELRNGSPADEEEARKLQNMKKRTMWKTLDRVSNLIKRDKKRERNSCVRRFAASVVSLASNVVGYVGNTILSWVGIGGTGVGTVMGPVNDVYDNLAAQDRNREYIDTEYPITDAQRIVAIRNYQEQLKECKNNSKRQNEIEGILSSREKLDNRIRNLQAGNHVYAHQEGLRDAIYQQYTETIAKEAAKQEAPGDLQVSGQKEPGQGSTVAEYEQQARILMSDYVKFLKLEKKEENKEDNKEDNKDNKVKAPEL